MSVTKENLLSGLLFAAFGAVFVIDSMMKLNLGTASRMGPGFFPVALGSLLIILGIVIIFQPVFTASAAQRPVPWRALFMITISVVMFGMMIRGLGLIGSTFISVLAASASSRKIDLKTNLMISVSLTIFNIVVFYYGLGAPIRLIGPWIQG